MISAATAPPLPVGERVGVRGLRPYQKNQILKRRSPLTRQDLLHRCGGPLPQGARARRTKAPRDPCHGAGLTSTVKPYDSKIVFAAGVRRNARYAAAPGLAFVVAAAG